MTDNLLPCPFCGGEARKSGETFERTITQWVYCTSCGAAGGYRHTEAEAIAAWNTRTERTCEFKPFKGPISDLDEDGNRRGVCSECNAYMHEQFCYCPNCGSRVIGG